MTTAVHRFELEPFGGQHEREALGLQGVRVQGAVALERSPEGATLRLHYRLEADLGSAASAVLLPPPGPPSRRDGLWQHTCLEAFLAPADGEPYWELNLAPSGDWALYRFAAYRRGQQSPALGNLPVAVVNRAEQLELSLNFSLPTELATASQLELAVTAVLEQKSGALSYWALRHPATQPDFHLREGFVLRL
jgi:hypothetical protein